MLSVQGHALDEVLAAIRAADALSGDWAEIAERVRATLAARPPSRLRLTARPAAGQLETRALHSAPDGSFSVVALSCGPGAATVVHDHVTWCVFAVLEGSFAEETFVLEAGGTALVTDCETLCPAGTVIGGAPPGDIHRLSNRADRPALSLHVYGSDVSRIGSSVRRTYDLPIITHDPYPRSRSTRDSLNPDRH